MMFTKDEMRQLADGKPVDIGNKRYAACSRCRRVLHVNGMFGSIHQCLLPHEERREARREARRAQQETPVDLPDGCVLVVALAVLAVSLVAGLATCSGWGP